MTQTSLIDEGETQVEPKKDHLPSPSLSLSNDDLEALTEEKSLKEPLLVTTGKIKTKQNDEEKLPPSVGHATHTTSVQTNMLTSFGKRLEFVSVTAPMTMRSGSTFVARLDGDKNRVFQVTVPDGGVVEGEEFCVFYPKEFLNSTVIPPYGRWKDRVIDCFSLAFCHQTVWFTFLFPLISLAHLFRRLKLTCCATKASVRGSKSTTRVFLCYTASIIVWYTLGLLYGLHYKLLKKPWYLAGCMIPVILLITYMMYLTSRARYLVRQRYNIPSKICGKKQSTKPCVGVMEDTVCGICCTHCTICQLSRQTADYKSYPPKIFRPDGLPRGTPFV